MGVRKMKNILISLSAIVVGLALLITPAFAKGATQVKDCASVPYPLSTYCNFGFWDGNGVFATYTPDSYHDVLTPSGNETEVFKGTIANDTGRAVIYNANSGTPIPSGQTCYSFVTQKTTPDWQLTISASGNYTLVCHFR